MPVYRRLRPDLFRIALAICATCTLVTVVPSDASASVINLKLAHFVSTNDGMHKDFMQPWAHALEKCSGGQVKVTIYPGGTQLGNVARLYDEVRTGVVDIANGLAGVPAGQFQRVRLMELPFMAKTAGAASQALWDLYDPYLKPDFSGVKVLALHATNGGGIHMATKRVRNIKDLKGMRIRFPSTAIKQMLAYLGAVPVGLPPGAVYENLEKGVIDGTAFTWSAMDSFKLAEVTKYHLDAKAYVSTFWFAMNQRRYNSLPKNVKACVDKLSGRALEAKFGNWWDEWDAPGLALVKARHETIDELSDAERQHWQEVLKPMINKYLDSVTAAGVSNAREIYAKMKERVAHYEK